MRIKENEINALTAFIEILQKIKDVEYERGSFPEKENRNTQDVEAILVPKDKDVQSPKIAVEHTIVEAYEDQIDYVKQSYNIVEEINHRCHEKLPTSYYFALIPSPSLIVGMNKKRREQFIVEMSNRIPEAAKSLTKRYQRTLLLYNKHEVTLWCFGSLSELNGTIGFMATGPKEENKERQRRFRRAIEEKLPKLLKYKEKEEERYLTALLLEDVSFSHSNPGNNLKELIPEKYRLEFQLKIDYIVVFVSHNNKMNLGSVWKEESQLYEDIPDNRRFSFRQKIISRG